MPREVTGERQERERASQPALALSSRAWRADETGGPLLQALWEAAECGVHVHLLATDNTGARPDAGDARHRKAHSRGNVLASLWGVPLRRYGPVSTLRAAHTKGFQVLQILDLRRVLGDLPRTPRFIETLPRRVTKLRAHQGNEPPDSVQEGLA